MALFRSRHDGFTLIELLMVVLIIGILAAIAIPVYNGAKSGAKDAAAQTLLETAVRYGRAQSTANDGSFPSGLASSMASDEPETHAVTGTSYTQGAVNVTVASPLLAEYRDLSASGNQFLFADNGVAVTRYLTNGGALQNVAQDPGFEYDTVGASPWGWSGYVSPGATLSAIATSGNWAASGSKSVHVLGTHDSTSTQEVVGVLQPASVFSAATPGTTYTTQCTVDVLQAGNNGMAMQLVFLNASNTVISAYTSGAYVGPGQTGVFSPTAQATAPAGTAYLKMAIFAWGTIPNQTMEFYADNFVAEPLSAPVPLAYFDGDLPAATWTGTPGRSPSSAPGIPYSTSS